MWQTKLKEPKSDKKNPPENETWNARERKRKKVFIKKRPHIIVIVMGLGSHPFRISNKKKIGFDVNDIQELLDVIDSDAQWRAEREREGPTVSILDRVC